MKTQMWVSVDETRSQGQVNPLHCPIQGRWNGGWRDTHHTHYSCVMAPTTILTL